MEKIYDFTIELKEIPVGITIQPDPIPFGKTNQIRFPKL
jgi:hypothetical protein